MILGSSCTLNLFPSSRDSRPLPSPRPSPRPSPHHRHRLRHRVRPERICQE